MQENAFKNVCEMAAILSRGDELKGVTVTGASILFKVLLLNYVHNQVSLVDTSTFEVSQDFGH